MLILPICVVQSIRLKCIKHISEWKHAKPPIYHICVRSGIFGPGNVTPFNEILCKDHIQYSTHTCLEFYKKD